jgi:hypothetical protein
MSDASGATPALLVPHYSILKGPNGLRAGWRLLIFFAILLPLGYGVSGGVDALIRRTHSDFSTPLDAVFSTDLLVLPLLIATWIMGRIERRTFGDFGLPWRRAFGRRFWQGACFSFVSMSLLFATMRLAGVFSFGAIALHGSASGRQRSSRPYSWADCITSTPAVMGWDRCRRRCIVW